MSTRTFTFNVVAAPTGDWPATWLANNPVGSAAWSGRWTADAVNMETPSASGLYERYDPLANPATYPGTYTYSLPFEDTNGGQMFDYDGPFNYDPETGLHTVGGGVGSSASYADGADKTWYVRYDPRSNRWSKIWNPVGVGTSHHYYENAMDRVGRKYYRRFWQFDLDSNVGTPTDIGAPPLWDGDSATAKVFHEGLGRFYAISNSGKFWYWTPTTRTGSAGTWSSAQLTGATFALHPFAAYHSSLDCIVFGGGNSPSNRVFKVNSAGALSEIDNIPAALVPVSGGSAPTMIIDCGLPDAFVVLFDRSTTPPVAPFNQIYLFKPNAPTGQQWVVSADALPSYMTSWSGFRVTNAAGMRHLGAIMVLRYYLSGTDGATDLKNRRPSVYFYKPSGA